MPDFENGRFCGARDPFVRDIIQLADLVLASGHDSDDLEGVCLCKAFVEGAPVGRCEDCSKAIGFVLEVNSGQVYTLCPKS